MDGTDAFGATAQTTGTSTSAFGSSVFGQPRQQQAGSVFSSLANNGNAENGSVFGAFGSPAAATTQPASVFHGNTTTGTIDNVWGWRLEHGKFWYITTTAGFGIRTTHSNDDNRLPSVVVVIGWSGSFHIASYLSM